VTLRVVAGDEKGSLRSETVKYGREYPRKTALARTSSIYKKQTRPHVREGDPQKTKTVTVEQQEISGHEPQMGLDTKTY
jgi:hypothetical protein